MTDSLDEINVALKPVGRIPRSLTVALFLVSIFLGLVNWANGNPTLGVVCASVCLALLVMSLRLKAYATGDSFILRSYFRTHRIPFERIESFSNMPYSGMWNKSAPADGWADAGLRMLEITYVSGRGASFPATMMSRKNCARAVEVLDRRMEEDRLHPLAGSDEGTYP